MIESPVISFKGLLFRLRSEKASSDVNLWPLGIVPARYSRNIVWAIRFFDAIISWYLLIYYRNLAIANERYRAPSGASCRSHRVHGNYDSDETTIQQDISQPANNL